MIRKEYLCRMPEIPVIRFRSVSCDLRRMMIRIMHTDRTECSAIFRTVFRAEEIYNLLWSGIRCNIIIMWHHAQYSIPDTSTNKICLKAMG